MNKLAAITLLILATGTSVIGTSAAAQSATCEQAVLSEEVVLDDALIDAVCAADLSDATQHPCASVLPHANIPSFAELVRVQETACAARGAEDVQVREMLHALARFLRSELHPVPSLQVNYRSTASVTPVCDDTVEGDPALLADIEGLCSRSLFDLRDFPCAAKISDEQRDLIRAGRDRMCADTPTALDEAQQTALATYLNQSRYLVSDPLGEVETSAVAVALPAVIASGIAEALVGRAEDEVSAFAQEALFAQLCGDDDEARHYLPDTCQLFASRRNVDPPVPLGVLRNALRDDLSNLPRQVVRILRGHQPRVACGLDVFHALFRALRADENLVELIAVPGRLSRFATTVSGGTALVCEDHWRRYDSFVQQLAYLQQAGREILRALESGTPAQLMADVFRAEHRALANAFLDTVRAIYAMRQDQGREKLASLASALGGLVREVVTLAWGDAARPELWTHASSLVSAIITRDYVVVLSRASNLLTTYCSNNDQSCGRFSGAIRTVTVIADIATADSAEEVQSAIEQAAEPIGSWRRKHHRPGVTINGYVGAMGGYELDPTDTIENGSFIAPTISLGFEGHWPLGNNGGGRMGIYIPVIDVGNLASIRLSDDDDDSLLNVETSPDVELSQLFAPGIYVTFGMGATPISLGVGMNYIPALRDPSDGSRGNQSVLRVGAFLAVDLSLIRLR